MKILFVTDLHGDIQKYEKTIEIALENNIDTIVNAGDILPKRGDLYFIQAAFLYDYLTDYFKKLEEKKINCLIMMGNDDLTVYDREFNDLCRQFPHVYNIAGRKVKINDYEFIGMNYILDTPFKLKNRVVREENPARDQECTKEGLVAKASGYIKFKCWSLVLNNLPTIREIMDKLPKPDDPGHTIYVTHMPPANLGLDVVHSGERVGSQELFDFFKEVQPRFTLHGHIHESPNKSSRYFNTIDNTICIQPGQTEFMEPFMVYMIIDLETKEMEFKVVSSGRYNFFT